MLRWLSEEQATFGKKCFSLDEPKVSEENV